MTAAPNAVQTARSVPTLRAGTGTNRSENVLERNGTPLTGYFEALPAFLERTANLPERAWIIPDLVPDTGRVFVVAAPNAGKTFLALFIAKAAVAQGRSVYLVLEEGGAKAMADRFRNLGFPADAPIFVAHLRGFGLAQAADRERLKGVLESEDSPVVVLDPFVSIFTGDENDTRAMNEAKEWLEGIVRVNPRALIVLCHHTSKAGERNEGGPGMYAARGSGVLTGWADVQINLKHRSVPKESGLVAFTAKVEKDREGVRGHEVIVRIDLGTGEVDLESATAEQNEGLAESVLRKVLSGPPLLKDALAKSVGGNRSKTLAAIGTLELEGRVTRTKVGYVIAAENSATTPATTVWQVGE